MRISKCLYLKPIIGVLYPKIPQKNIIGVIIVNVEHWHKNWGQAAKDPVFWFIAQSKKASLEKKPLPSSIRKVGEATQKEEAIGKVSNLVSEVSLVLALCKSVIN